MLVTSQMLLLTCRKWTHCIGFGHTFWEICLINPCTMSFASWLWKMQPPNTIMGLSVSSDFTGIVTKFLHKYLFIALFLHSNGLNFSFNIQATVWRKALKKIYIKISSSLRSSSTRRAISMALKNTGNSLIQYLNYRNY